MFTRHDKWVDPCHVPFQILCFLKNPCISLRSIHSKKRPGCVNAVLTSDHVHSPATTIENWKVSTTPKRYRVPPSLCAALQSITSHTLAIKDELSVTGDLPLPELHKHQVTASAFVSLRIMLLRFPRAVGAHPSSPSSTPSPQSAHPPTL